MPKYHVEFDIETAGPWSGPEFGLRYAEAIVPEYPTGTRLSGIPNNATITEIKPEFEEGWYQHIDSDKESIDYWTLDEIAWHGSSFGSSYRRMNPPTPYEVN